MFLVHSNDDMSVCWWRKPAYNARKFVVVIYLSTRNMISKIHL